MSYGGGVYVSDQASLTLKDQAAIRNCSAEKTAGGATYGGGIFAGGSLTIKGSAKIGENCTASIGSGIYMEVPRNSRASQNMHSGGGVIAGEVVLNNSSNYGATLMITGSDEGVTEFKGSVLNNNGIIEKGKFTGEVTNNGTISGGVFTGTVSNNGTITGGTFSGGITGTPALATGSGTETDPYQIGTAEGLKWFRDKVNDAKTKEETKICAVLTADIDLKNEEWTPIGIDYTIYSGKPPYAGTFDGKGHTIKNLSIDNSSALYVGLFGYVYGGTFENCANLCEVQGGTTENDTTGGIIGFAYFGDNLIVRDCYNVGSITGRHAGGIIGQCNNWLETIRNCYNAGTVTGTANAGAIIGNYSSDKIYNCYYLEGSVTRAGYGDNVSIAKTATEFADGTVLALLKAGERDNNADPWADECQYLAAADKTLPVFNGQGDAHDHQSNDWESNETEHWQVCTCGAVFHKAQHSGGKATCKAKAKCADCGAEYGDTNPNHHGDKLKHVVAKDATTSEEGNIEYWYCEACGKYFSDNAATKEITQAETVIPKRQSSGSNYSYYTIKATAGAGGSISPSGSVSVREGRDQTFTITPDKGYAVANVKIDGKSIGAVKSYTFENVRRTHTIEVIFMKANGNPQTGVFVDVATGSYYEDAVDWAVENGITQGTDDTHFSPDGICTRAQAVTFLWRAAGSPEPETRTMPFTDVPVGSYYYDAVLWAVENGITKGTSNTTFSPNMTCSRAQIVAFLWRSEKSPAAGTANPFADVKSTAYYAGAVLWAVREDITKGTTSTTFSPDADCSRA